MAGALTVKASTDSIPADAVLVGIPSRNEATAIGHVVAVAMEGLRGAGLFDRAVLVNADNGSTDSTSEVFAAAAQRMPHIVLSTGAASTGKGSNVLAILEMASKVDAERVVLLDADVRTIEVSWIRQFLSAVEGREPRMAVPIYRRNRFEGNTTNHIASPLLAAVFGVHVQQPIAGDFAFNRSFIRRALSWPVPESANLYGIDIHLTAHAAREGLDIRQIHLGQKLHNPGFPKILFGSQQVIDSLFHVISCTNGCATASNRAPEPRQTADPVATRPDPGRVSLAAAKVKTYINDNLASITATFPSLAEIKLAPWGFRIDTSAWATLLADALQGLADGLGSIVRDHLVALYFCRVMTYWEHIEALSSDEVDAMLDEQTAAVIAECGVRRIIFRNRPPSSTFEPGYWRNDE